MNIHKTINLNDMLLRAEIDEAYCLRYVLVALKKEDEVRGRLHDMPYHVTKFKISLLSLPLERHLPCVKF